jgi:hypothetical protein
MTTRECPREAGERKNTSNANVTATEAQHDRPAAIEKALRSILMAAFDGSAELQRSGVTPRLHKYITEIEQRAGVAAWTADYSLAERGQP